MMTQAEQYELLLKDISRAVKAGLVTRGSGYTVDEKYFGEFLLVGVEVEVASDIVAELLDYLKGAYPDIRFRQISRRTVYYDLR